MSASATRHALRAPTGRFVPLLSDEDWLRLLVAARRHPYGFWGVLGLCPYCDRRLSPAKGGVDKVFCDDRHQGRYHYRAGSLVDALFPRVDGRRVAWAEAREVTA